MRLFTLALFLPSVPQPIRLNFKDETRAKTARLATFNFEGRLTLNDDFGVEAELTTAPIARVLCGVAEELEAGMEIELLRYRTQMKAQKRVQSDPTLSNGGAIINPGGMGGPVIDFPPRGR